MATSQADIRDWHARGATEKATHLVVVCDTYDHEEFPVFVHRGEDVHKVVKEHNNSDQMSRVMEVYTYALDLEPQIAEPRSWHLD